MYIEAGLNTYLRLTSVSIRCPNMNQANHIGHDFWTRLIPQITHSSFVVRRAVISAASVLESTQYHDPATRLEVLNTYRMNVRSTIKSAEDSDPEYALLASLLFASSELVMGALDAGMIHLKAGSKVLKERMDYLSQNSLHNSMAGAMLLDHILPIFAAYSQITSAYGVDLISDDYVTWHAQYDCVQMPPIFVTTDQAHAHLRSTAHQIFTKIFLQDTSRFENTTSAT